MSAPTPQQIIHTAKELHKFYRAATKAIGDTNWSVHDHGWQNCRKKAYFMRRAVRLLRSPMEPEQSGNSGQIQFGSRCIR